MVLHNWWDKADHDLELIDGYEELPAEAQEKVKRALENTHVDDEDWNGVMTAFRPLVECRTDRSQDTEMNRYNPDKKMQGMFKKKETAAERKKREKAEVNTMLVH